MIPVTARMFISLFMLRGLMSLKYDDFPKHFDRSTWDGCLRSVVLPLLAPNPPTAMLFEDATFCFLLCPLLEPVTDLPTSVSDKCEAPAIHMS